MPLVAAVPLAPTDLAWRVIGLVNLYRLLVPPSVYALFVFSGSDATLGSVNPQLFQWICVVYFATGIAIVAGGRRLLGPRRGLPSDRRGGLDPGRRGPPDRSARRRARSR